MPYAVVYLVLTLTDREEQFYPSGPDVGAFLCGPVGLIEDTAIPALQELGFENGRSIFAF